MRLTHSTLLVALVELACTHVRDQTHLQLLKLFDNLVLGGSWERIQQVLLAIEGMYEEAHSQSLESVRTALEWMHRVMASAK